MRNADFGLRIEEQDSTAFQSAIRILQSTIGWGFLLSTRSKLLLAFTIFGVLPVVALGVVGYLNGRRAVEAQLRGEAEREVRLIAGNVDGRLREREDALT